VFELNSYHPVAPFVKLASIMEEIEERKASKGMARLMKKEDDKPKPKVGSLEDLRAKFRKDPAKATAAAEGVPVKINRHGKPRCFAIDFEASDNYCKACSHKPECSKLSGLSGATLDPPADPVGVIPECHGIDYDATDAGCAKCKHKGSCIVLYRDKERLEVFASKMDKDEEIRRSILTRPTVKEVVDRKFGSLLSEFKGKPLTPGAIASIRSRLETGLREIADEDSHLSKALEGVRVKIDRDEDDPGRINVSLVTPEIE